MSKIKFSRTLIGDLFWGVYIVFLRSHRWHSGVTLALCSKKKKKAFWLGFKPPPILDQLVQEKRPSTVLSLKPLIGILTKKCAIHANSLTF